VSREALRALLWLVAAAVLLTAGFLAWLLISAYLAGRSLDPAETARLQLALVLYARVVLFKGLLPQLVLAFALWPLAERVFALERRGWLGAAAGMIAASAVASVAIAGLLLPSNAWGLAAVRYPGLARYVQTCAEMTAAAAAALMVSSWLLRSRARVPVWLSGVAVACIGAGLFVPQPAAKPIASPTASSVRGAVTPPGAAPPAEVAAAPAKDPVAPDDYPVTSLPLELLATQLDETESRSRAIVVDLVDLDTATLHVGDAFANHPEARLAKIEAQRVLIDRAGRLEQLAVGAHPERLLSRLSLDWQRQRGKRPDDQAIEYRRSSAERLRERIDHPPEPHVAVGGLLADGTPTPVYEQDELVGFAIESVRPGGVYDRIGLREGDRVDAINGVALGDPGATEAVIAALGSAPRFELAVERNGRRETLSIPTDQIIRELAGRSGTR
jgi:general secretion pathway protein C